LVDEHGLAVDLDFLVLLDVEGAREGTAKNVPRASP